MREGQIRMSTEHPVEDGERRDFIILTAQAMAGIGAAAALWPFIDSMNPSADVLALSTTEVDISPIAAGQEIKVMWRGKPVFIRHRTPENIAQAEAVPLSDLRDPQTDAERVKPGKAQWLVQVGICTHLGCVPVGNQAGEYHGWFCPCHGSHYDTAGRIRKGPAPINLVIPPYEFLSDTKVKIG